MSEPTFPRPFTVQRDEDLSGVSGEGVVAEGVQFSDGWAVTHWLDKPPMNEPKTDVWHNKGSAPFEKIHGHGGATRILWADEVAALRRQFLADVVEAYDVPAAALDVDTERVYTAEQIGRALRDASGEARQRWDRREWELKGLLGDFTDALMPIVSKILEQRDQVLRANGRAYGLARSWQRAHGSSMFLVRAAGAELRDVLDDSGAVPGEVVHLGVNGQASALSGVDYMAAAECPAQHHGFPGDHRECIRPAQHRGDHIDEHGFRWSDTVAVYPVVDGEPLCGRAYASSCSNPDHACKICGECVYEHPGEGGCAGVEFHSRAKGSLEELADAVRSVLGIDVRTVPADVNTWLLTACRQLEKSEEAREHLRGQRNEVAQVLREALAAFREEKGFVNGTVLGYRAPHPIHPSNFNRWRAALEGLPANCQKPGGCSDCPHEMGA